MKKYLFATLALALGSTLFAAPQDTTKDKAAPPAKSSTVSKDSKSAPAAKENNKKKRKGKKNKDKAKDQTK
jgi:hypothetical protein